MPQALSTNHNQARTGSDVDGIKKRHRPNTRYRYFLVSLCSGIGLA
jgi:hypothetical protein